MFLSPISKVLWQIAKPHSKSLRSVPHHSGYTQKAVNFYFSWREISSEILKSFVLHLSKSNNLKKMYNMLIKDKNHIIISMNTECLE